MRRPASKGDVMVARWVASAALVLFFSSCSGGAEPAEDAPLRAPAPDAAPAPAKSAPVAAKAAPVKVGDLEVDATVFSRGAPVAEEVAICVKCHGVHGSGDADFGRSAHWGTPDLRGQTVNYLVRQLKAFADGHRVHPEMAALAAMMDADDRDRLAQYYAAAPVPTPLPESQPEPGADPALHALGRQIAEKGREDARIMPCAACHMPHGAGNGDHIPHLAGQNGDYIRAQLRAMKEGRRTTPESVVMGPVIAGLTPTEVDAVASYYEGFLTRE